MASVGPVRADVQRYCQAYARDAADAAASGTGLVDGASAPAAGSAKWQSLNAKALNECLAQYSAAPAPSNADVEAVGTPDANPVQPREILIARASVHHRARAASPAPAGPVPAVPIAPSQQGGGAATGTLQPGSAAWNEYCARKYVSFNPATGTYRSFHGNQRRCAVTRQ